MPVTPRPAATVMLVRDQDGAVEVFLMERSMAGVFGGLHVFPGGKVDDVDHSKAWEAHASGPEDAVASQVLGIEAGGLGYWVACIRECFEEAGVLLATWPDGRLLELRDPEIRARFSVWRERVNAREAGAFEAMCDEEELRLATDRLAYVSHWITPLDQPARFNTRFFVARAPAAQEALHDGHEAVQSLWIRPREALEQFKRGELNLISPTFKNLEAIAGFADTESLLAAKRAIDPATIPTILPRFDPSKGDATEVLDVIGHGGRVVEGG
jgi:8-oxo-dGTP pyrophosphatase MutT (NUDIX family)